MASVRRDYWREYRRAHPQGPRDRAAYFAQRHAAHRQTINADRRLRYALRPTGRRAIGKWRDDREKLVADSIQAEREALHYGPEVAALVEAQARDARTFNIKRPGIFVSADVAERLFYGGVYPES